LNSPARPKRSRLAQVRVWVDKTMRRMRSASQQECPRASDEESESTSFAQG
jgi:hypothetical protein